jgi:hypothetical protein
MNAASYDSASQRLRMAKFFYVYVLQSHVDWERFYTDCRAQRLEFKNGPDASGPHSNSERFRECALAQNSVPRCSFRPVERLLAINASALREWHRMASLAQPAS